MTAGNNSVEYVHDRFGRVVQEKKNIQGQSPLVYTYEYNNRNQLSKACYPDGLTVEYEYDQYGNKTKVKADGKVVYQLVSYDGLTSKSSFLGKLTSSVTRDKNGFESNVSILRGTTVLDSLNEQFDPITGNLLSRTRKGRSTELFEYDNLDRLIEVRCRKSNGSVSRTMAMDYAKNGNITSKSDIGRYSYDANFKPHAVVELYNDNEDALPATVQSYVISPIGKVQSISQQGAYTLNVTYGPDLQRCHSELKLNGTSKRKTIYGGAYEKTIESGISREFYYLDGNVIVVKQDGVFTPYLAFTDNLGSYLSVVDSLGNRVFFAIYDAWGKQSISAATNKIGLRRGYCGHEMLNEFNLINMNGRIYSPYVGRFLAPDNYVQAPDNTQNFNRYSYCLNNPLKYTDPSGDFFGFTIFNVVTDFLLNIGSNGFNISEYDWTRTVNSWKIDMGMFKGDFGQVMNKWTWGVVNSLAGNFTSQLFNTCGQVDGVTDMDGMIALSGAIDGSSACTIGHYSLGPKGYKATWKDNLFVHEYGHYIQTQRMGVFMFPVVAIPSLFSAAGITSGEGEHLLRWFEQDASATAAHYFDRHYGSGVEGYKDYSEKYFHMDVFFYGTKGRYRYYTNPRTHDGFQDHDYKLVNPMISFWDFIL